MELIIFFLIPMGIGLWAQHKVKSTFARYSDVPSSSNRTGAEVARAILDRNGLHDVEVRAVPGALSDHYNPADRTVNLSEPVFGQSSISAVSVAAHEVGHAIQHARAYAPLAIRSAVFPAAAFGSNIAPLLLMGGVVLTAMSLALGPVIILVGIVGYSFAVLFQLVTLPVEFDASRRAKGQLRELALVQGGEHDGASKVLSAAAMTYVAGALAALAQLLYFISMFVSDE